jgi:UDP-N-acetylmuramyl pentapeptide phosphotransferase/UDP-N-acetylglucosamine-1-phosphate transferase
MAVATAGGALMTIVNTLVKSLWPPLSSHASIWSAMLVPLFIVLLSFSNNRELRRKPVFLRNIGIALVGIVLLALMVSYLDSFHRDFGNDTSPSIDG